MVKWSDLLPEAPNYGFQTKVYGWMKGFFEKDDLDCKPPPETPASRFKEKAYNWVMAFFEKEESDCASSEGSKEKSEETYDEYDLLFDEMMKRNSALHDILTSFSLTICENNSKMTHLCEATREISQLARQRQTVVDSFRDSRRQNFVGILEAIQNLLATKVELLAAEKNWLIGKTVEQEELRDDIARTPGDVLRQVLKSLQDEYLEKMFELGMGRFVEVILKKKTPKTHDRKHYNPFYDIAAENKLLEDFWRQLNLVSDVVSDGKNRLKRVVMARRELDRHVGEQQSRIRELERQTEVYLLRFVSENEVLMHGSTCQLEVVELLNDLRHLTALVDALQGDVLTLKSKRNEVETGVQVLQSQDVDIGRAISELGKFLQLIEALTFGGYSEKQKDS